MTNRNEASQINESKSFLKSFTYSFEVRINVTSFVKRSCIGIYLRVVVNVIYTGYTLSHLFVFIVRSYLWWNIDIGTQVSGGDVLLVLLIIVTYRLIIYISGTKSKVRIIIIRIYIFVSTILIQQLVGIQLLIRIESCATGVTACSTGITACSIVWTVAWPFEFVFQVFCKSFLYFCKVARNVVWGNRWCVFPIFSEFMTSCIDLLKSYIISLTKLQHINVYLLGTGSGGKSNSNFTVNILFQSNWIIKCPHQSFELSKRRKAQAVSCKNQRVDHHQKRLHLLRIQHVIRNELSLQSHIGGVSYKQVARYIVYLLPEAYLSPWMTLSAIKSSQVRFLFLFLTFATSSFYALTTSACLRSLQSSRCILALRAAMSICDLLTLEIFFGCSFPMEREFTLKIQQIEFIVKALFLQHLQVCS